MQHMREWLESTAEEDARLYEQYGKPLEKDHAGEYMAISPDGQTILSNDPDEILRNYPGLVTEDILACLAYARDMLRSEKIYPLEAA